MLARAPIITFDKRKSKSYIHEIWSQTRLSRAMLKLHSKPHLIICTSRCVRRAIFVAWMPIQKKATSIGDNGKPPLITSKRS